MDPDNSQAARVHLTLRDAILRLELAPGQGLSERSLGDWLGASRTPIRAALQQLELEGLVQRSGAGYRVAPINLKEMLDAYDLRTLIERDSVSRLARREVTNEEREEAEAILGSIESRDEPEPKIGFTRDFHLLLARFSGNELYVSVLGDLLQRLYRARYLEGAIPKDFRNEHRTIWEHICAREETQALAVVQQHIERSRRRMLERVSQYVTSSGVSLVSDRTGRGPGSFAQRWT